MIVAIDRFQFLSRLYPTSESLLFLLFNILNLYFIRGFGPISYLFACYYFSSCVSEHFHRENCFLRKRRGATIAVRFGGPAVYICFHAGSLQRRQGFVLLRCLFLIYTLDVV